MAYSYVVLGDSLSVGVGSSFFSPGFVQRYRRFAEKALDEQIYLLSFAQSGSKTEDVLLEIQKEFVANRVKEAEIVTVTAGGNDLIDAAREFLNGGNEKQLEKKLNNSIANMKKILENITNIKKHCHHPYIVRVLNLYNPFPNIPLADEGVRRFNRLLKGFSNGDTIIVADIYKIFKNNEGDFLSIDGVHPNDNGYERMAEKIHRLGYGGLETGMEEE
ncbi:MULTISPECIES: GDSL-type esterase/lipase family protein [unclassified Bacillus (in: firmicutes)]|uniref:GDSL-type esterase/lipase family protein n=1 Tax=unclassified Bacillus (in: firmicutes) TaxID=185979 RepID=UPI0008E485C2|nr:MULTISPECIES: GDSL-type esterase/lipase family protein [unclassified Bacillus (in: firmicutes)]SFA91052.1 Lysophospholipase L1 [Bacillus sp. UNCCL13]SFQ85478.1 Lysophospholipase L1 [Bacillus sp. cl95]